jgi:hypothetical protein
MGGIFEILPEQRHAWNLQDFAPKQLHGGASLKFPLSSVMRGIFKIPPKQVHGGIFEIPPKQRHAGNL